MSLVVVIIGLVAVTIAFGPTFSNHVWSTIWAAIFWPRVRTSFGARRWTTAGKKPSMLEK